MIEIKNLKVCYANVEAVSDVSFFVKKGEITSLVGESGCGKSTILKAIAGLVKKEKGEITFSEELNLGMIFQNPALLPQLSVLQNVIVPLEIKGLASKKHCEEKAVKILDIVGLSECSRRLPREISGGQQQRVAIARALVTDPNLLLMDEPFGKLDTITKRKLHLFLLELWEKLGQTILFVTHDIEEAVLLSKRVVVLSKKEVKVEDVIDINFLYPRNNQIKRNSLFFELVDKIEKYLK